MSLDPERFRVSKGRGARWYVDDLPADDLVPNADEPFEAPAYTTIGGAWPKFLVPWACSVVAETAVKTTDWRALDADTAIAVLKSAPDRVRDTAAQRGTVIHRVLEDIAAGVEPATEFMPEAVPYLPAMRAFVTECRPRWVLSEAVGFNRTVGYAGTLDALLFLDALPELGVRLADFKTRDAPRCYPENAVQVAAYAGFEYVIVEGPDGQPVRRSLPAHDGGLVVAITPNGYALFPVDTGEAAQNGVRRLRDFWAFFRAAHSLIGPPVTGPVADEPLLRPWLIERVAAIVAAGQKPTDFLVACWPRGVPTFKQSADHDDAELAQIEAVLDLVEKECSLPFSGPRPGAMTPASTLVPPDTTPPLTPPTVLPASVDACQAMIARLQALPSDLLAVVEAEASKQNVPNLRSGRVTVDEMAGLDQLVSMVEPVADNRQRLTTQALGAYASDELGTAVLAVACHGLVPAVLTEAQIARVRAVVAALDVLLLTAWYASEDGLPALVPAPNAEAELIAAHGSKSALLAVAKTLCEGLGLTSPKSATACCADPLLAALLHEARLASEPEAATSAA